MQIADGFLGLSRDSQQRKNMYELSCYSSLRSARDLTCASSLTAGSASVMYTRVSCFMDLAVNMPLRQNWGSHT